MNTFINNINEIKSSLTKQQNLIFAIFETIDKNYIDIDASTLFTKNDFFIIKIIDKEKIRCPFLIDFGIGQNVNKVQFYFINSAPIVEDYLENDTDGMNCYKTIFELLKSKIIEELYFVDDKLTKAKYSYYFKIGKNIELVPHVTYKKINWFWEKRTKVTNEFIAWI